MSILKVIIVTYNWPPRNAIGTHRPYAWARYWSEAGAHVTVLTARKHAFDEPLDMPMAVLDGVKVVEVPYGGVRGELASKLLQSQGARKLARRIKPWLVKTVRGEIDPRSAWRSAAKGEASQLALKADVVVSTYGPAAAHLIACDMKLVNPSIRWVADYRDLWSQQHASEIYEQVRSNMRETELASVGTHADLITAVSDDMVHKLHDLTGKPVLKFQNGYDLDEDLVRQRLKKPSSKPEGPLRIVYTGQIYRGQRDPKPLLEALSRLHATGKLEHGEVTVDFYGARVELAEEFARMTRYGPFIRIMGHIPRVQALEIQSAAGLLLLLESSKLEARGVLTGKLFEYISSGRPILCIGSQSDFEIGQVLTATGTGVVYAMSEQEKIERAILRTLAGGGLYDDYCPNFEEIVKFSRKRIAKEFLGSLEHLVFKT